MMSDVVEEEYTDRTFYRWFDGIVWVFDHSEHKVDTGPYTYFTNVSKDTLFLMADHIFKGAGTIFVVSNRDTANELRVKHPTSDVRLLLVDPTLE